MLYFVSQVIAQLTHNGQNDNDEVKNVPCLSKVMPPQSNKLNNSFKSEDCCEDNIHYIQDFSDVSRLIIMVHCHYNHIEENYQHDKQLEPGACCNIEEKSLTL